MQKVLGVLLAGGQSRRFGRPKAFAKYNGRSFWECSYIALKPKTDEQMIISHPELLDQFKKVTTLQVLEDDEKVKGKGPMAGIYTAMKSYKAEWYLVLSCDIPLVTEDLIESLLKFRQQELQAIVPKINGKLQPLIGVYHHTIFEILERQLVNGKYRLIDLLEKINVVYVNEKDLGVDTKIFSNINTPEDYTILLTNDKISES